MFFNHWSDNAQGQQNTITETPTPSLAKRAKSVANLLTRECP